MWRPGASEEDKVGKAEVRYLLGLQRGSVDCGRSGTQLRVSLYTILDPAGKNYCEMGETATLHGAGCKGSPTHHSASCIPWSVFISPNCEHLVKELNRHV